MPAHLAWHWPLIRVAKSEMSGGLQEVRRYWTWSEVALALEALDFEQELQEAAEKEAEKRSKRK